MLNTIKHLLIARYHILQGIETEEGVSYQYLLSTLKNVDDSLHLLGVYMSAVHNRLVAVWQDNVFVDGQHCLEDNDFKQHMGVSGPVPHPQGLTDDTMTLEWAIKCTK